MQIMSLSVPIAPQTTGHPYGLPENRAPVRRETRIEPVANARNPDAGFKDGKKPLQFWRSASGSVDPSTHIAPPSIMQIKISQMLSEQTTPSTADDPKSAETASAPDGAAMEKQSAMDEHHAGAGIETPKDDPREGYAKAALIAKAQPWQAPD